MTATDHDTPTFAAPGVVPPVSRETFVDPDLADDDLDGPRGELDPLAVLAEIAGEVELADIVVPHRYRPGWAVRYSTEIDNDDLKRWRKAAKATGAAGKRGEIDDLRFACISLANLCQAVIRNGEEVTDGAGTVLTFANGAMRKLYRVERAADVVRKFYGNDPYLGATFDTVLREAGVGDEVETLDPTTEQSD